MTRYLTLLSFTDSGLREVKKSRERAAAFRSEVEAVGGKVLAQYWAFGDVDGCVAFEAPDDATASMLLLKLGQHGQVRTRSLRVFNDEEFGAIANQM